MFKDFAKKPPMGWNSWDCYGCGVTENELLANAEYIRDNLLEFGWEYVVCDIQWSAPDAKTHDYQPFTELSMDEYSRLVPAVRRFPSAADGKGFLPIAEKIHAMGLKFGIHIMRGIPRQAVHRNTKIMCEDVSARDIASAFSVCPWNTDMYGIDYKKHGAQEYYNSIIALYASWGVDYIKCDDISNTEFLKDNPYSARAEIEMLRRAIDNSGRNIVLSLSPGPAPVSEHKHLSENANLWRMSGDFWDSWEKLLNMFTLCRSWAPYVKSGTWPDCDMLPLGTLCAYGGKDGKTGRKTKFTIDEQKTMLSLWSIFRSPLMLGGVLPETDGETLELITNPEVLEPNRTGNRPQEIKSTASEIIWVSSGKKCIYAAMFNISNKARNVTLSLKNLLPNGTECSVRDLWERKDMGVFKGKITFEIQPHAVRFIKLS